MQPRARGSGSSESGALLAPDLLSRRCRAVEGVLKGYDQLLNLVLDETTEFLRGAQPCRPVSVVQPISVQCEG